MNDSGNGTSQCELCAYYDADEDVCNACCDEDDIARFMSQPYSQCRYFSMYDEYKIVRKQN